MKLRYLIVPLAAITLVLPMAAANAQGRERGIKIIDAGLTSQGAIRAKVLWDKRDLRDKGKNALTLSLVATSGDKAQMVFTKRLSASATHPKGHYSIALNAKQRRLIRAADGLGFAASQKSGLVDGLYSRVWVTHSGAFPSAQTGRALVRSGSRCSPITAGGNYTDCYYGYLDLSNSNFSGTNFSDATFSFSNLQGTNLTGSKMAFAQLGYAMMQQANLTNVDLSGAYLFGTNLSGATITGATFTNAQFCNTIMPDGSKKNDNC